MRGSLAAPNANYELTVVTEGKALTITPNEETAVPPYKPDGGRAPEEKDGGGVIVPSIPEDAPQDNLTVTDEGQIIPSYTIEPEVEFPQDSEELIKQSNEFPTLALVATDKTTVYLESKDMDDPFAFEDWIGKWADFFAYSEATYLGRFYIHEDASGKPYFTGSDLSRLTYENHQLALFAVDGSKEAYGTWQHDPPVINGGWKDDSPAIDDGVDDGRNEPGGDGDQGMPDSGKDSGINDDQGNTDDKATAGRPNAGGNDGASGGQKKTAGEKSNRVAPGNEAGPTASIVTGDPNAGAENNGNPAPNATGKPGSDTGDAEISEPVTPDTDNAESPVSLLAIILAALAVTAGVVILIVFFLRKRERDTKKQARP
jgi:hypothetical protein